jgi:hypothetical protein
MSQNDGLNEEKLAEVDTNDVSAEFIDKIMTKCAVYQQNRLENKAKIASLQAGIMRDFGETTMQEYSAMKLEHQETILESPVAAEIDNNDGQQEGK